MAATESLVAGDGEGVQRLHTQRLRRLEDTPRRARRVLDEDLAVRVGSGVLPLVGRGEQSSVVRGEGHDLVVVDDRGGGVGAEVLAGSGDGVAARCVGRRGADRSSRAGECEHGQRREQHRRDATTAGDGPASGSAH